MYVRATLPWSAMTKTAAALMASTTVAAPAPTVAPLGVALAVAPPAAATQ